MAANVRDSDRKVLGVVSDRYKMEGEKIYERIAGN